MSERFDRERNRHNERYSQWESRSTSSLDDETPIIRSCKPEIIKERFRQATDFYFYDTKNRVTLPRSAFLASRSRRFRFDTG